MKPENRWPLPKVKEELERLHSTASTSLIEDIRNNEQPTYLDNQIYRFLECSSIMDDDLVQLNNDQRCTLPVATENFYSQGYSSLCSFFAIVSAIRCAIRKYAKDYHIPELLRLNYSDRIQHTNMIRLMGSHVHPTTMDGLAKNMRMNLSHIGSQAASPVEIIQESV